MNGRDVILARIRERLGRSAGADAARRAAVQSYIAVHALSPRPRAPADLAVAFREHAVKLATTCEEVAEMATVPQAVRRYLEAIALPARAICWGTLSALDWRGAGIGVEARPARGEDAVGITSVFCAIAETGTLVTLSGPATPASVSLVPEVHIAVVPQSRLVASMEEAWAWLRKEDGAPPRAVNFISGPSRTADIEQTVTLGAHGPARVHVVLVGGA